MADPGSTTPADPKQTQGGDVAADQTAAAPAAVDPADEQRRVADVLRAELTRIDTPEAAEKVVREVEQLAAGATEAQRASSVAQTPTTAGQAVQEAADQAPGTAGTAAALTEAAAQVVAPTPESPAVAKAVADVLPPRDAVIPPETERGRRLLREALLRRMQPLQALDTRAFLVVNGLPHPRVANLLADTMTIVTTGGWIWVFGIGLARVMGVPVSRSRLWIAAPSILVATWAVEQPIKALFRRRRPFIDIVRALVVGRRPDGWSFPSGHSAAAFSGAWVLSTVWPSRAPVFFALAASVGFSRVYVGAHYPSDVISGAMSGLVIAEAIRRTVTRWLGRAR